MPENRYAIGVDYGTNSVRALIVDVETGEEIGTSVWNYQSGDAGVLLDLKDPHLARQNPADYQKGFDASVRGALSDAAKKPGFSASQIVGLGVDTTGSTPVPLQRDGTPLGLHEDFAQDLGAMAWLWKDHTSYAEAAEITELAAKRGEPYLSKCGGTYSSEWFWSKILHCARTAPKAFEAAFSWCEFQDLIPAWITGNADPLTMPRGICAAGHKAMFHTQWGGLPSKEFLAELHPGLASLRDRLYAKTMVAGDVAGRLTAERANATGLPEGIAVSVGAMDAHLGAIGSGVKPGTIVKIMGTSTCDILVSDESTPDIPGVCGIVPGSVIPGMMGIEAGQSAVGDLFNWCASKLGDGSHEKLTREAERLRPGETGLLALDWNNGNRTILVDPQLTGLLVGQTLATTAGEIYRTLIEATAFGSRKIIERIREYGVRIDEIVVCGGLAEKSPLTMQIYADVCGMPIKTSRSAQTCALGSAVAGSVAGGAHSDFAAATAKMTALNPDYYKPEPDAVAVYNRIYSLYEDLHDAFGRTSRSPDLHGLMKELLAIRRQAVNG